MVWVNESETEVNEFGLWIPAFAGMTVMVRLPCRQWVAFRFRWFNVAKRRGQCV